MDRTGLRSLAALAATTVAAALLAVPATAAGVPPNDDFAAASPISPPLLTAVDSTGATTEPGEPLHAGAPGRGSVWFTYTAPADARVRVTVCGFPAAPRLGVYTGADVGALTPVGSDVNSLILCSTGANHGSSVAFSAAAGTAYRIAVAPAPEAVESFSLIFDVTPANDDFAAATVVTGLPAQLDGSTRGAGPEPGEPAHGTNGSSETVWYTWTAPTSGPVTVQACRNPGTGSADPLLGLYSGSSVGALAAVARVPVGPSCFGGPAWRIQAVAGNVYRIAVDGSGANAGGFTLRLAPPPGNDSFASATQIDGLPQSWTGSNFAATVQAGEPNHSGILADHSVWYRWTAPSSGSMAFEACRPDFAVAAAVYTGTRLTALTERGRSGDARAGRCAYEGERAPFSARAGETYWLAVATSVFQLRSGNVELALFPVPANDQIGAATTLTGAFAFALGQTNVDASHQVGEGQHADNPIGDHSVWYRWTAPAAGPTTVDTCSGDFDTVLAVYTGSGFNNATEVAADDDSCVREGGSFAEFNATAGQTYWIAVDGYITETGNFDIYVEGEEAPPPPPARPPPARPPAGPGGAGPRVPPPAGRPTPPKAAGATAGNDRLRGTPRADRICGLGGSDIIDGLAGSDSLFGDQCPGSARSSRRSRAAAASDGNDKLIGSAGNDRLYGAGGRDTLSGGAGKDKLVGGKGRDRISGGSGKDNVNAKDRTRDRVNCGPGRDTVKADRSDRLRGCERRR